MTITFGVLTYGLEGMIKRGPDPRDGQKQQITGNWTEKVREARESNKLKEVRKGSGTKSFL